MPILNKFRTNVKEDDIDLDFDTDFDSFGGDTSVSEKSRSPVMRTFKGAIKGAAEEAVSPALLQKTVRSALPKEYGQIYDNTSSFVSVVPALYDEAVKEIKPGLQATVRNVKKLVPQEMKRTQKLMNRISEIVGDPSETTSNKQYQDREIKDTLSSIFLEQSKTYAEDRAEDNARENIKENLEAKRAKNELQLLSSINVGVRGLASYNDRINAAYQKKSLELQYRSYFTQVDLLDITKKYYGIFKQQFTGIEKNTSLPDLVKMRKGEQFADIMRTRFFNNIQGSLFGNNQFVAKSIGKLKKAGMSKIGDFGNFLSMLEMTSDMMATAKESQDSLSGFDDGPKKTKGEMVAGWAGGQASSTLAGMLGEAVNKRLAKPGSKVQKYGLKGIKYASDIPAAIKDLRKSGRLNQDYTGSGLLTGLKNLGKSGISNILDIISSSMMPETLLQKESGLLSQTTPTAFTNQTQKSIVSIIPGYLSRIHREIQVLRTGDESTPLTEYDLKSDKFMTRKQLVKSTREFLRGEIQSRGYSKSLGNSVDTIVGDKKVPKHVKEGIKQVLHNANFSDTDGVIDVEALLDDRNYEGLDPSVAKEVKTIIQRNYNPNADDYEKKDYQLTKTTRDLRQSVGDVRGYIESLMGSQEDVLREIGLIETNENGQTQINMKRYKALALESPSPDTDNATSPFGSLKSFQYTPPTPVDRGETPIYGDQITTLLSSLNDKLGGSTLPTLSDAVDTVGSNETLITISENVIDIRKLLEERKNQTYESGPPKRDLIDVGESVFKSGQSGFNYLKDSLFPRIKDKVLGFGQSAKDAKDYIANLDEEEIKDLEGKAQSKIAAIKQKGSDAKKGLFHWLEKTGISKRAEDLKKSALEKGSKAKEDITASKGYKKIINYLFGKDKAKDPSDLAKDVQEVTSESDTDDENTDVGFLTQLMRFKNTQMEKGGKFIKDFKQGFKDGYADAKQARAAYNDTNKDGERDGSWRQLIDKAKRTGFKGELAGKATAAYRSSTNVLDKVFDGAKSLFNRMRGNADDLSNLLGAGSDALAGGAKQTSILGKMFEKVSAYGAARGGKLGKAASILGSVGSGAVNIGGSILGGVGSMIPESFAGNLARGAGTLVKEGGKAGLSATGAVLSGAGKVITSPTAREAVGGLLKRTRSLDRAIVKGGWNLAKEGVKLGAKGGWEATKLLGQGALAAAQFATPKLIMAGLSGIGGLATAIGGALTSPIGLTLAAGYSLYKGYQYFTRNKASDLTKIRLLQYGLTEDDKSNYYRIFELESLLSEKALNYGQNGAYLAPQDMDEDTVGDMFKIFDIEKDDPERQAIFTEWFSNRFEPIYIKHINSLFRANSKRGLDEVDKLKDEEKKVYLSGITMGDAVYQVSASPFTDIRALPNTQSSVKSSITALTTQLENSKTKKTGKHTLVAVSAATAATVVKAGMMPPLQTSTADKMSKMLSNKTQNLEKVGLFAGPLAFLFGVYESIVQPIGQLMHRDVTALEAVRFRTYGLVDMDRSKVSTLRNLEAYLVNDVKIDPKGNPVFTGDIQDVVEKQCYAFGISSPRDVRITDWLKWFKDRFLPVYLAYIGTGYQYTQKKDPEDIERSLKEGDKHDVALKIAGISGVWDIKAQPWPNMVVNTNSSTIDTNINYLYDRSKDKKLKEQSADLSVKAESNKSIQEGFDYSQTSDAKFFSKLWGGAKDIASSAWDATKKYAGKAWDHAFNSNQADEFRVLKNAGDATKAIEKGEQEASDKTDTTSGGYAEGGKGMVPVDEQQGHSTRKLPITGKLKALLAKAGGLAGIDKVVVFSGGQPATGPNRVGSHRHDFGNAADIRLIKDGKHLSHLSPNDLPYYKSFAKAAAALGATGIGAGPGYMGPTAMHVGFGPKTTWGRGGKSANAPQWLREAVGDGWKSGPSDAFKIMEDASNIAKGIKATRSTSGATGSWNGQDTRPMGATATWDPPSDKLEKGEKEPKDGTVDTSPKTTKGVGGSTKTYYGYYKPHGISSGILSNPEWIQKMHAAEDKYGIPRGTLQAIAAKESTGNPNAKSPADKSGKRGWGLGQFRNATAQDITKTTGIPIWKNGQVNMDPSVQIEAMAALLAVKKKAVTSITKQQATWDDAIWAYNAGEGTVARVKRGQGYGGMPADPNYLKEVKVNRDAINGRSGTSVSTGGETPESSGPASINGETTPSSTTTNSGGQLGGYSTEAQPGQAFRSLNVPDGAMTTIPRNDGIMKTSYSIPEANTFPGFTGPIKPNAMTMNVDPRAPKPDQGAGFNFGGMEANTKSMDDTLKKSLDVQSQMLAVLKTMAQSMTPEAFSNMVKGMVPVSDKTKGPTSPAPIKTKAGGPEKMPKPAVSLARTVI